MGAYLHVLALLCLFGTGFSQECVRELKENVDFPGSDLKYEHATDVQHCQRLCTELPACLFFTFIRADWTTDSRNFYCYLKSTTTGLPNVQNPLQGVTSGYSLKPCNTQLGKPECVRNLQENVNFPGSDLTFVFSPDVGHCQRLCTEHPACLFFTFIRADWTTDNRNFYCYLKSTTTGLPNVQNPLQGVTSGYSLKACNKPEHCQFKLYHDVDFPGMDYGSLFISDHEECQRTCTLDPYCQFFTYVNERSSLDTIRYKCHLKFSWTVPRMKEVKSNPGVTSGFSNTLQASMKHGHVCKYKLFPNTNIAGNNVEMLPSISADHCLSLCSAHPKCSYFTYYSNHPSKKFQCYLRKVPGDVMVLTTLQGATSGLPARNCQLNNQWVSDTYEDVDFLGNDMRYVLLDDVESCERSCSQDANCQFYSYVSSTFYNSHYRRHCYLKRSITIPTPQKVQTLPNAVSGFTRRGC